MTEVKMKHVRGGQWWLVGIVPAGLCVLAVVVALLLWGLDA